MQTILKAKIDIERQEGDTSLLEMEIPNSISLVGRTIHFEVFDRLGLSVFRKVGADWTVVGQNITATLLEEDTKGRPGAHRYELEIWDGTVVYTLLTGVFLITPERIKNIRH